MKNKKRIIAIAVALTMSLALLAACGPSGGTGGTGTGTTPGGSTGTTPGGGTGGGAVPVPPAPDARLADLVDIIKMSSIGALDPFVPGGSNAPAFWAYNMYQDSLLTYIGPGEVGPQLATRWETDDYKTWTFWLRDDVYFHNGDKFTAADVLFTIELSQESTGFTRSLWGQVDTAEALDPYTVRLVLEDVNVDFEFVTLIHPAAGFFSERAMNEDIATFTYVGTGPFSVTNFVSGDHVVLDRFDDYWGEKPPTQTVVLRFVPEPSARTIMLINHESHICADVVPEDLPMFADHPEFTITSQVMNNPFFLAFNMAHPVVSDINFRMAMAHAINSEDIAPYARGAEGAPETTGTFWGQAMEFKNNDIPLKAFNLELAQQYLDNSVYNGEALEIIATHAHNVRAAEMVEQQLSRIGVNIVVRQMDNAGLLTMVANPGATHVMVIHTSSITSVASDMRTLLHSTAPNNRAGYINPEIDRLLELASTQLNRTEREGTYRLIQELLAEDIPYLSLYKWTMNWVHLNGIGGMRIVADNALQCYRGVYLNLDVD